MNIPTLRHSQSQGFALIVTLTLMILLTVIAVGLLTLSSISLRSSSQESAMATARANARVALIMAIGDLQENAGPDQRVSARADIVKADSKKPRLTGIWDSWEITSNTSASDFDDTARESKFRGWLTSGIPTQTRDLGFADEPPLSVASPGNGRSPLAVKLWDTGTVGATQPVTTPPTPENIVTVNKIPITSPPGALAWAVMDEGVKVRINTRYEEGATGEGSKTASLGAGKRPGVEFIDGLDGLNRKFFETGSPESLALDKGVTRLNFSLVGEQLAGPSIPSALMPLAHEVTTHSLGLFTDTARGGLKEDFHLLTNSPTLPSKYKDQGVYASREVTPTGGNPSDPRWESLQQFATVYKERDAAKNFLITKLGNAPLLKTSVPSNWNASTKTGTAAPVVNRTPPPGPVLVPTIAKVQMLFSLIGRDLYPGLPENIQRPLTTAQKAANMHAPQDGVFRPTKYDYDLHLLYTPIVTLHNPYNVALQFTSMRLEFVGIPFSMQVFRNGVPLSTGLVPFESMTKDNQNSPKSKTFGMNLRTKVNNRVGATTFRMLPGEVILFSPYIDPATTYAQDLKNKTFWDISLASSLTAQISAIPGWRGFGIGYDVDWLAGNQASSTLASQGHWDGCYGLAWDDQIHVEFAPLGIPANNNKFIVQMSATVNGVPNKKLSAIEIDYESPTGLQKFLNEDGSTKTLRYPKEGANPSYKSGFEMRNSSTTPIRNIDKAKPFALLTAQARNTSSGIDNTNQSGRFAGKPWSFTHGSIGVSSQKMVTEHSANHSHELDLLALDENDATQLVSVDPQDRSRFISGNTGSDNSTKFGALYDIPIAPIQTLAGLNGANPGGSSGYLPRFAQPIGNSWAHPLISSDRISESGPSGYNYADHSFLLNLALYDGFYFSGLADQTGTFGTGKTGIAIADAYSLGTPLDDPRLTLLPPPGKIASDLANEITQPDAFSNIAAWQAMEGAFNINSTSVPAWKAMLASIHDGQSIANQRASAAAIVTGMTPLNPVSTDEVRISRMRLPASNSAADGGEDKDAYWLGPREYSDDELQTLAENIVKQVRLRGPFLSMAEFVNRRLGSASDEMSQRGALQQAIDDSNLNQSLASSAAAGYEIPASTVANYKYKNPAAGEGPSYQGAPGYLTQADLLNVLGNAATARSDTFTIRGYGESRDSTGKLITSATCEAVVQRVPQWVDPVDAVETPVPSLASASNRIFGRKFVVTSFRWLNSSEI